MSKERERKKAKLVRKLRCELEVRRQEEKWRHLVEVEEERRQWEVERCVREKEALMARWGREDLQHQLDRVRTPDFFFRFSFMMK